MGDPAPFGARRGLVPRRGPPRDGFRSAAARARNPLWIAGARRRDPQRLRRGGVRRVRRRSGSVAFRRHVLRRCAARGWTQRGTAGARAGSSSATRRGSGGRPHRAGRAQRCGKSRAGPARPVAGARCAAGDGAACRGIGGHGVGRGTGEPEFSGGQGNSFLEDFRICARGSPGAGDSPGRRRLGWLYPPRADRTGLRNPRGSGRFPRRPP